MNRFHLLLSVCGAVFVYVCISFFAGQEGVWVYKQLQNHKIQLNLHVKSLQERNEQLTIDFNILNNDLDVIAAYAKKMGFIADGEKLVKINGLSDNMIAIHDAGSKSIRPQLIYIPEWLAKSIGFLFFVFYNLICALVFLKRRYQYDSAKVRHTMS